MSGESVIVESARTRAWPFGDGKPRLVEPVEKKIQVESARTRAWPFGDGKPRLAEPVTDTRSALAGWHAKDINQFNAAKNAEAH